MRQNLITIAKGDKKAKIVETSLRVWKEKGWEKTGEEPKSQSTPLEAQSEGDKAPKGAPDAKSPDRGSK